MKEKYFCVNNLVYFKILYNFFPKRLWLEYSTFECTATDDLDFILYLGNFSPSLEGCTFIDYKYFIKEDFFYCVDTYKHGKWRVEVSGLENKRPLTIRLSTNLIATFFADMFIGAYVIDFFIRFCLNEKGYSVIHASSVGKDGKGYLFPSQSGAGKTTTVVYFANSGYDYIGDDFVIFKDGILFNYLTPLNLFSYNLNPIVIKGMSLYDKYLIKIKDFVFQLSSGYVKIFSKMNPVILFSSNVGNDVPLKKIFLFSQQDELSIKKISKEYVINNLFINQKIESFPFFKYFLEYSYVFPNSNIAAYWDRCLHDIKENLVEGIEYFELGVPKKYTDSVFRYIRDVVENVSKL